MANIGLARKLRKQETWAEKLMWRWLRDRRFSGYKFRRQHAIGAYSLDFFCEEAELAIELDGRQHGFPNQQRHNAERQKFLKSPEIKMPRSKLVERSPSSRPSPQGEGESSADFLKNLRLALSGVIGQNQNLPMAISSPGGED